MAERTIRGATTSENTVSSILKNTKEMLEKIIFDNNININEITSIVFTATKDLTKAYPAVAAREIGITSASLMCVQEMYVENSLEKCIRCMVTVNTDREQAEMKHIYLKNAVELRPDLLK